MNVLQERFGTEAVLLPVVHTLSADQTLTQVDVATRAGAHGVFLIAHGDPWHILAEWVAAVMERFDTWVGVNALDLTAAQVFTHLVPACAPDGVWTDDAGIGGPARTLSDVDVARSSFPGLYFGGVAFKYRQAVSDVAGAASRAARHMDVVCTSGAATGVAAEPEKLVAMANAAAPAPLAVASGVTVDNVAVAYRSGARAFLVATSIEADFGTLDAQATATLAARVRLLA